MLVTQLGHFTVDEPSAHCGDTVERRGGGGVALSGEGGRADASGQGGVDRVQGEVLGPNSVRQPNLRIPPLSGREVA